MTPAHYPADPTKFVFDGAVAKVFDNMAERSIPGYRYFHERVAGLVRLNEIVLGEAPHVWDFGSTMGTGLAAAKAGFHNPLVGYHGCDISPEMVAAARERFPWGDFVQHDLSEGLPSEAEAHFGRIGVAIFAWTLQFMPSFDHRAALIRDAYRALRPGGMLFVAEKFDLSDSFSGIDTAASYYAWRRDNGYSLPEITAKSAALKSSMWPWRRHELIKTVRELPGARWDWLYQLHGFGGLVVVKPLAATFR